MLQTLFGDDLASAYASALNDWTRGEFLDRDPRFRASIVVSLENIELAVAEIERCAPDQRFVQVLLLVGTARPLGRRQYWPIYEACVRHGLSLGNREQVQGCDVSARLHEQVSQHLTRIV